MPIIDKSHALTGIGRIAAQLERMRAALVYFREKSVNLLHLGPHEFYNDFSEMLDRAKTALPDAPDLRREEPKPLGGDQIKARLLELARPINTFIREHKLAGFLLDDGPTDDSPERQETFSIALDVAPLPPRIRFVLKRYGSICVEETGAKQPDPGREAERRVIEAAHRERASWTGRVFKEQRELWEALDDPAKLEAGDVAID